MRHYQCCLASLPSENGNHKGKRDMSELIYGISWILQRFNVNPTKISYGETPQYLVRKLVALNTRTFYELPCKESTMCLTFKWLLYAHFCYHFCTNELELKSRTMKLQFKCSNGSSRRKKNLPFIAIKASLAPTIDYICKGRYAVLYLWFSFGVDLLYEIMW